MAPRTIFANLTDGLNPFNLFDQAFADSANLGVVQCTAGGTNTIALTPVAAALSPNITYATFYGLYEFVASNNSTGPVQAQIVGQPLLNVYKAGGVQAGAGDISINNPYILIYNSTLNLGAGGFFLQDFAGASKNIPLPTNQILVGNVSGNAAPVAMSGDATIVSSGTITVTKTSGASFGTMATQNANSVAITGGTITGLPTPSGSSDAATKQYVDNKSPILTNARLAKSSNYTVANGDKGSTIALGGSTFFVLTINAASGYDANFAVLVLNEDTTRAKTISINGITAFYLWPNQSIIVYNSNNTWQVNGRNRWITSLGVIFNVNHASGSDNVIASDGLGTGAGAFATIQNAVNVIMNQIDCDGNAPTIQNTAETFTETVSIRGVPLGYLQIFITGSPGTPTNTVWQTSGQCLSCRDGGTATLNGFKFVGTGSGQTALAPSQFGDIDVANVEFGTFAGGYHIQSTEGGSFNNVGGTYVVSGNCITHWFIQGISSLFVTTQAISVPNALTFTNWLQIQGPGYFQGNGTTFSGTGSGAGSTGQKYNISLNGVALTSGATLPGASAGGTATGGQYN